ncbi:MAG: glycosyltransferase family 39 protein [Anaerolineales bacterium]|nr:glycosyltransferase family 39 protein [Anaerolineales bacterium]
MIQTILDVLFRARAAIRVLLLGLTALALAAVCGYLAVYLCLAAARMGYPYELEWIEGGFAGQVSRILAEQTVYGPPSIEFTPFIYTPLYFYLSASAARIFGDSLFSLRLVSVLSSLAAMAGTFALVFRRNRNLVAAALAAGLLAASYRITGAWLDVGRVDSLSIALLVLFCWALPQSANRFRWVAAGGIAALMVLAKQSMTVAVLPFFLVHMAQYRRRSAWMLAGFLAPLVVVTGILHAASDGWYSFYTVEILGAQADWLGGEVALGFWTTNILRHYFVSLSIGAAGLVLILRERRKEFWQWLALLAGALLSSFLARIKAGGFDNVLLPSVAVIGILLGIGWDRIAAALWKRPEFLRDAASILLTAAALYQLYHLRYSPADQLPTQQNLQSGAAFVEYLAEFPGEVYVPYHTGYAVLAGKPALAHQAALWDVLRGDAPNRGKKILLDEITAAVLSQRFDVVILDGAGEWNFLAGLEQVYALQPAWLPPDLSPTPLTGWQVSPQSIFLPRDGATSGQLLSGFIALDPNSGKDWRSLFPYLA